MEPDSLLAFILDIVPASFVITSFTLSCLFVVLVSLNADLLLSLRCIGLLLPLKVDFTTRGREEVEPFLAVNKLGFKRTEFASWHSKRLKLFFLSKSKDTPIWLNNLYDSAEIDGKRGDWGSEGLVD